MSAFFATTPRGVAPLAAEELGRFGAEKIEAQRAGVAFAGSLEPAYRACLWSRMASRILLELGTFPAPNEEALYQGVAAIDWTAHFGPEQTIAVDFAAFESSLTHSHYGALKTKDAIVDQFRTRRGRRPTVERRAPDIRIYVHVHADQAAVGIDLSGESLHRRGYRAATGLAPLKENLAAAILCWAGWPERARAGEPLVDPMCGAGTLPIEAALMAADRAPGLLRERFGFAAWRGHDAALWRRLLEEAKERARAGADRLPPIYGYDADAEAVRAAIANLRHAGLPGRVCFERRALADVAPPPGRGLVVANPPYGERLGDEGSLAPLYQALGDTLRRRFLGWTGWILAGNSALAKRIGLRPTRRIVVFNGPIECRLLEFPISAEPARQAEPGWRRPRVRRPETEMFSNRVRKNLRHLRKWARRERISCFRVYDADLPEYAVAVDLYPGAAHVQEYEPPSTVDPKAAAERLEDIVAVLPELLDLPASEVHLKVHRRQRRGTQYGKLGERSVLREVEERGCRFLVNLSDYLDTGLFLDQRIVRQLAAELGAGRDVANLFCYTATSSVAAARGGARSTTSVDHSNTYLDWAAKNFSANQMPNRHHRLVRDDCLRWLLRRRRERYGLILVDPPTFSNRKGEAADFDLARDHVALLQAASELLTPDGIILFTNHSRRFKLAELPGLRAENITRRTIPPDFARNPRIHNAWLIRRR